MISIFSKRFWELRKKRKKVLDAIKTCRGHAFYLNKTYGLGCWHCNERTYSISVLCTRTSLAGEKFYSQSYPIAYVCPRCETISAYETTDGGKDSSMLVWDWLKAPCRMPKAVIQIPGRIKPPIPPEPV